MIDKTIPFLEKNDKLICFGDSLTEATDSYVRFLQAALPQNEVVQSGRGGDKTTWALTRFERDVLSQNPQAVSIMLGTNDAIVGRGIWADEPAISPEAYRCNLVWMVHLCHLRGIRKISIATPFGYEGRAFLDGGKRITDYALAARDAADEMKAYLVPLDALWVKLRNGVPETDMMLTRDGIHPLTHSYKAIAEACLSAWNMK